jgi:hypothetical protein
MIALEGFGACCCSGELTDKSATAVCYVLYPRNIASVPVVAVRIRGAKLLSKNQNLWNIRRKTCNYFVNCSSVHGILKI